MHTRTRVCARAHTHTHTHTHTRARTHVRTHARTHARDQAHSDHAGVALCSGQPLSHSVGPVRDGELAPVVALRRQRIGPERGHLQSNTRACVREREREEVRGRPVTSRQSVVLHKACFHRVGHAPYGPTECDEPVEFVVGHVGADQAAVQGYDGQHSVCNKAESTGRIWKHMRNIA